MDAVAKGRVVRTALLAFALWPLVQMTLVWRYDVSPWKLAGWGMYAAPRFGLVGMEVYGRAGANDPWQQLATPSLEARAAAHAFLERHRWLRRLASSRELVGLVRAQHPEWSQVRVDVAYPELDRTSGYVRLVRDERVDPGD